MLGHDTELTLLYFIQQGINGPIKIGRSDDPWRRLEQLQTASPQRLHLVAVCFGTAAMETEFHDIFAPQQLTGEWFDPADDLLDFAGRLNTDRRDEWHSGVSEYADHWEVAVRDARGDWGVQYFDVPKPASRQLAAFMGRTWARMHAIRRAKHLIDRHNSAVHEEMLGPAGWPMQDHILPDECPVLQHDIA